MTRFSRPAFPIPPSTLTPGTCGRRVHDTSLMVDVFVIGGGPAGASAARSGVRLTDAVVRRVDIADPTRIAYVTDAGRSTTCRARFVLDCSGRAGIVARRGWRRRQTTYRTLAIAAEWESSTWSATEQTRTLVESYRDGWAWSVPLSPTRRQFTVMVENDQHRDHRAHGEKNKYRLNVLYSAELAKTHDLAAQLVEARQTTAPWACDASVYTAERTADAGVLLVGDAASFIEPLSSAGVKKA